MSAFVVSREHINVLVSAGLRGPSPKPANTLAWGSLSWFAGRPPSLAEAGDLRRELTPERADAVAGMLCAANVASVRHHYRCPSDPLAADAEEPYRWTDPAIRLSAVEVLKAIDCFVYQACEPPAWQECEAKRFCDALRDRTIDWLPGYPEAPWEWRPEHLRARRRQRLL